MFGERIEFSFTMFSGVVLLPSVLLSPSYIPICSYNIAPHIFRCPFASSSHVLIITFSSVILATCPNCIILASCNCITYVCHTCPCSYLLCSYLLNPLSLLPSSQHYHLCSDFPLHVHVCKRARRPYCRQFTQFNIFVNHNIVVCRNQCGCYEEGTIDGFRCFDDVCQCRDVAGVDVSAAGSKCVSWASAFFNKPIFFALHFHSISFENSTKSIALHIVYAFLILEAVPDVYDCNFWAAVRGYKSGNLRRFSRPQRIVGLRTNAGRGHFL